MFVLILTIKHYKPFLYHLFSRQYFTTSLLQSHSLHYFSLFFLNRKKKSSHLFSLLKSFLTTVSGRCDHAGAAENRKQALTSTLTLQHLKSWTFNVRKMKKDRFFCLFSVCSIMQESDCSFWLICDWTVSSAQDFSIMNGPACLHHLVWTWNWCLS